jgi:LPXTG-motif cell wall-anchored protein
VAVVNSKDFEIKNTAFAKDSSATITLENYKPNYLKYVSDNSNEGLAVFSEIYYGKGWNAYIDGKSVSHTRVDYVLRALNIPAGKHTIEFKFEPQVIKTGSTITLISSIGMLLLLIGGIYFVQRRKQVN